MSGNPYRYTGRRLDPQTGLYYYRARYYDPKQGRFLQTDPIGYEDQMNLYTYVGNDPVNGTDPTGEDKITCESDGDNLSCSRRRNDDEYDTYEVGGRVFGIIKESSESVSDEEVFSNIASILNGYFPNHSFETISVDNYVLSKKQATGAIATAGVLGLYRFGIRAQGMLNKAAYRAGRTNTHRGRMASLATGGRRAAAKAFRKATGMKPNKSGVSVARNRFGQKIILRKQGRNWILETQSSSGKTIAKKVFVPGA